MEGLIFLLVILIVGLLLSGTILGIVALVKISELRRRIETLHARTDALKQRVTGPEGLRPAERAAPSAAGPEPLKVSPPVIPASPPGRPEPPRPLPSVPPGPPPAPRPAFLSIVPAAREDFEKSLGQRWMTWVGAVLIMAGIGFFVQQALTWAGPRGRVAMGIVIGAVLLVVGDRFSRRAWRAIGQGLMGAGLGAFYLSFFAAFSRYNLMPQTTAFAAMALCTAAAMTLALLHDAVALAILAVLGGFLTPVMLSTGVDARDTLFAYLLLLDLGVLAVAFFRKWSWLDVLAFLGTVTLYGGWYNEFYKSPALVPALLWLGGFYLVFLVLPFLYHFLRTEPAPWPRFLMALANAGFAFSLAYVSLRADYLHVAGFVALGLTACYVVLGMLVRWRISMDVRQPLGFLSLAVGFLVLAAPLHFKADGTVLAWTIDAPILLFLGYRYRYFPLRVLALIVLALVAVYGLLEAWPEHVALFTPLLNRRFVTAIAPALSAAVFALLHRLDRRNARPTDNTIRQFVACTAGLLALVLVHAEFASWFSWGEWEEIDPRYYGHCFSLVLWTVGAVAFTLLGVRLRSLITRITGVPVLAVSFVVLMVLLVHRWPGSFTLFLNVHFAAMLVNLAAVFALAFLYRRAAGLWREERVLSPVFTWVGTFLLLVVLSVENYRYFDRLLDYSVDAGRLALMSVSVVWGLYAFVMLGLGILRRRAPVRYVALALFGLTVFKVVVLDTSELRDVYRWITYLAVGCLLVAGSYLYYRLERYMASSKGEVAA